jgi:cyclic pyranopterin phosphate synthase
MPEDMPYVPPENIMRYEEILRLCAVMVGLGVKVVRVTGGEPLVRKGCVEFLRRLKAIPGIRRVSLTTNTNPD